MWYKPRLIHSEPGLQPMNATLSRLDGAPKKPGTPFEIALLRTPGRSRNKQKQKKSHHPALVQEKGMPPAIRRRTQGDGRDEHPGTRVPIWRQLHCIMQHPLDAKIFWIYIGVYINSSLA